MSDLLQSLVNGIPDEFATEASVREALAAADHADPIPPLAAIRDVLPEKGVTVGLHRLLARALADAGHEGEADRVMLHVAERVNQAGFWGALAQVLTPLLERHPQQAGPLLIRARLQGGAEAVSDALLFEIHRLLPNHGVLGWETAQALLAAGDEKGARRVATDAMGELLEDKNYPLAEEAVLLIAEARDLHTAKAVTHALQILAHQDAWREFDTFLEVGADMLATPKGAAVAWPVLREQWLRHPDRESLRPTAVRILEAFLAEYPDPASLIRNSRIHLPSEEVEAGLDRLAKAMMFPPGYYALHMGWGIGKIRDNDTTAVVIDFPNKPMHRMTLATAERALDALEPGDLRVLNLHDRAELTRMVKEEPATVVFHALRRFKDHQATVDQIRKVLVPDVVPSTGWAGWWKATRAALGQDPRLDTRRAYDNVYRLRRGDEEIEEIELPVWNPRQSVIKSLGILDTFLQQHPEAVIRVAEEFGGTVTAAMNNARLPAEERATAALWLKSNLPDSPADPSPLVQADFDFNALPKALQERLLDCVETPEALVAALNSRGSTVRRRAWEVLRQREDLGVWARRILKDAGSQPEAALHILEEGLENGLPGEGDSDWSLVMLEGLFELIESPPRETHRKRAMALLGPEAPIAQRLRRAPVPDEDHSPLSLRLKNWRSSDRFRFPILDFLSDNGHADLANEVEGHRARTAAKLAARTDESTDPFEGQQVMTRITFERVAAEHRRLGMELKTEIPRAIQKARELGDLKENAEYHAAKAKQADYANRLSELEQRLQRIRVIEDIEREAGVVYPGTEVVLQPRESAKEPVVLWVLGQGDEQLGENVISYKAPLGEALFLRREGDEVSLPRESGPEKFVIREVRERLP